MTQGPLLCDVGHVITIEFTRVLDGVQVARRGQDAALEGEDGEDCFDRTGGAEEVAHGAFIAAHVDFARLAPPAGPVEEEGLDGPVLGDVPQGSGGCVGVDVVDRAGRQAGAT